MQYGQIQYMIFGIGIYGDGNRKPWENWARGLGGYAQWVVFLSLSIYMYIFIMVHFFFASNLVVFLNCKFPKNN